MINIFSATFVLYFCNGSQPGAIIAERAEPLLVQ